MLYLSPINLPPNTTNESCHCRAVLCHAVEAEKEDLRRWHEATLGRETRILELKREVNELLAQLDQAPRYPSAGTEQA